MWSKTMIESMTMMFHSVLFLYCLQSDFKVLGQKACTGKNHTLDSCDGRISFNSNDTYMDFGAINSQCSCTVKPSINGQSLYVLYEVPKNVICGTSIRFTQSDNITENLHCSLNQVKFPSILVLKNLPITIQFSRDGPAYVGDDKFCIRMYTNNEYPVTASCGISSLNLIPTTSDSLEDISQNTTSLQKTKNRNGCLFESSIVLLVILLAVFVAISIILAILSIYLKLRINSLGNEGKNAKSQSSTSGINTDSYTELSLSNMAAESSHPYDSFPRQDNYLQLV
uniref:Uncharacterized protein LOC111102997 isoform X1 n=1 Tax=Crassostrea virginica TaxID=6565 RepID=A0A8B8ANI4_CRAVI|nr:uncharacterized protein LOC111102997 isoform X1 [Crassostrea virginica]